MRIAFLVTEFVTERSFAGGLANYTNRICKALCGMGHEPEVFVPSDDSEVFSHEGILVHRVGKTHPFWLRIAESFQRRFLRSRFSHEIDVLEALVRLQAAVSARHKISQFELVHYTNLGGCGALRGKVPSVVRLSSHRDLWIPYGFHFSSALERLLEDVALWRADAVIAPSHFVADYVSKKMGIPVKVIESPFVQSSSTFDQDDSILLEVTRSDRPFGLFFGSLSEWKGVFVLADALLKFLPNHPDWDFVIVGPELSSPGGGSVKQILQKKLHLVEKQIRFQSEIQHNQLFPLIETAGFVCLPSLADNLPNACLEAMWLEKVVIGTIGASFDQLIEHGYSGILCERGDADSLFLAMNKAAILNPDQKRKIGIAARERIRQLSPEKVVNQLVEFYQEIIDKKNTR